MNSPFISKTTKNAKILILNESSECLGTLPSFLLKVLSVASPNILYKKNIFISTDINLSLKMWLEGLIRFRTLQEDYLVQSELHSVLHSIYQNKVTVLHAD